jgi:hypothetical protein
MSLRTIAVVAVFVLASTFAAASTAKDFKPGDLRICNTTRCVTIKDQKLLDALGSFIYMGRRPAIVRSPRLGVAYFELKFRNGYVAGIVATATLDRWLSYGVYIGRFARGRWYHVPAHTAAGLRRATVSLKPLRLTRAAVRRSR